MLHFLALFKLKFFLKKEIVYIWAIVFSPDRSGNPFIYAAADIKDCSG